MLLALQWPADLVPPTQPTAAKDYMLGNVWPVDPTVFPDYFKSSTKSWWANEIALLREVRLLLHYWLCKCQIFIISSRLGMSFQTLLLKRNIQGVLAGNEIYTYCLILYTIKLLCTILNSCTTYSNFHLTDFG